MIAGLDVVDDPPADLDFATAHRLKPSDAAQERALAAARGANQHQQLTVGDIENALRFDNKLLTRVFYVGVVLAVAVYIITLTTFQIFSNKPAGFTP